VPRNILIIDQALEFGGSIVSAANLIRSVDSARFNFVLASANKQSLIRQKLRERSADTQVVIARKAVQYKNSSRFFRSLRKSRYRPVQRLGVGCFLPFKLLANLPYMIRIARCIRKYRIDLVQLNNGIDDEVSLVCMLLGVKHVAYLRGHSPLSWPQRRFFLPGSSCFFAVSDYIRRAAIDDGFEADKILVAPPLAIREAVAQDSLAGLRRRYGLAEDQPAVGIFGRIVGWKGQKQFIEAAALVSERSNAQFFVVGETTDGEDDYYSEVLRTIKNLGLGDRVVFTGYVESVYDYYALMDVVVHASILPEPFGRVVLEAMSQGKPVIAATLGGPRECITEGEDGFLVDPWDRDALANRILQVIQDAQLREKLGRAAKHKVEQHFGKQAYGTRIAALYAFALDSDSHAGSPTQRAKQAFESASDDPNAQENAVHPARQRSTSASTGEVAPDNPNA
jgi:glycosyltransferase involved in cell wall biosynthesis